MHAVARAIGETSPTSPISPWGYARTRCMPGRNFSNFSVGVCTHAAHAREKLPQIPQIPRGGIHARSLEWGKTTVPPLGTAGQRGLMPLNTQSIACQIIPLKNCVFQLVARDGMEKLLYLARSGSLYGWISLDKSSHEMLCNMMTCYGFMLCGSLIWWDDYWEECLPSHCGRPLSNSRAERCSGRGLGVFGACWQLSSHAHLSAKPPDHQDARTPPCMPYADGLTGCRHTHSMTACGQPVLSRRWDRDDLTHQES